MVESELKVNDELNLNQDRHVSKSLSQNGKINYIKI